MDIENIEDINLNNSSRGMFVNVANFGGHSEYGLRLTAFDFAFSKLEIRQKDNMTAMFIYKYDDITIPEFWKDADVIYTRLGRMK
jgi:hypothetical protein